MVDAMLPAGTNVVRFRSEAERIASRPSELKAQHRQYLSLAHLCTDVIQALPDLPNVLDKDTVSKQFRQQRDECEARADFIARHKRKWRFWRYFELLALGEHTGFDLGYVSAPQKRRTEHPWPKPHGPGITYLQKLAEAIGAPVGPHQARDILQQYTRTKAGAHLGGLGELKVAVTIRGP
jgi:hypothetical protein